MSTEVKNKIKKNRDVECTLKKNSPILTKSPDKPKEGLALT